MNKTIPFWKKALQWSITLFLGSILLFSVQIAFEEASDDYRGDYSLASDLNSGRYGDCVDYYYVIKYLDGVDEEVYDRYEEFVNFYETYMMYVQYEQYNERHGVDEYAKQADECVKVMQDIAGNTTFFENEPHYEYLLGTLGE